MTKEQQLRIYSAYLPYDLRVGLSDEGKYNLDSEYPNEYAHKTGVITEFAISNGEFSYGEFKVSEKYYFSINELSEIKPVLYDLSYLTKEIEHEGERFVPIVELAKIGTREENCYVTNGNIGACYIDAKYQKKGFFIYHHNGYFMWQVGKNAEPLTVWDQHKLFQKLYEWHFNIYQLTEGQFINKATLTNK